MTAPRPWFPEGQAGRAPARLNDTAGPVNIEDSTTTRTSRETVTFRHPFRLSAVDDEQPAGSYIVETEEELLQAVSFPAYRRLSTIIHLAGMPKSSELGRVVAIDPGELAAVRTVDAQAQDVAATPAERVATGTGGKRSGARAFMIEGWKRLFAPRWP